MNLWILTEERPKNSVVLTILQEYCKIKKLLSKSFMSK